MIYRWLAMVSLSIILLTGLSTSSFFLPDFLTHIIEENEHTASQLSFALSRDNEAALLISLQESKYGSDHWQKLAKNLAKTNGKVSYELADFFMNNMQQEGTISLQSDQAILWYQQAIRLNYDKASIALAKLLFLQDEFIAAQKLLAKFNVMTLSPSQRNDDSLAAIILLIKIAISVGNVELVNSLHVKFASLLQTDEMGISLLSAIEKYQILSTVNETAGNSENYQATCPNSIQVFATNLIHLQHVESLVEQFKKKPLNDDVCFTPIRYIPLSTLSCSLSQKSAILCDESKLDNVAESITSRYIAVMLPKGGANVHFGVLYFDPQDNIDVLEHEISHLLGFIDEYPLVKGHVKCRASQDKIFSQNIAVLKRRYKGERSAIRANILKQVAWAGQIKESTPILQSDHLNLSDGSLQKNQYWQLGTPEGFEQDVGLYRAETCDNNDDKQQDFFGAFKPLSGRTKLQYNTVEFPPEYETLIQQNTEQFLMPSFHYNLALAFYQQGNVKLSEHWLKQAESWENKESRRDKVRKGDF